MSPLRLVFATILVMGLFPTVAPAIDSDFDAIDDDVDNCPLVGNIDQADGDGDGVGNVCDNCNMTDNADQADDDMDGIGNECDDDVDNDGVFNEMDNCVNDSNADQLNNDGDAMGDICDDDDDDDGVSDDIDNCPLTHNADQADLDRDGHGDVCKPSGTLLKVRTGISKRGLFMGYIDVPINETTPDWRIDVTFRRNIFNLQIVECEAKLADFPKNGMGKMTYTLAPGDKYETLEAGDVLKIKFIAKTYKKAKGVPFEARFYLPLNIMTPE
ncbi:uncharacterized protein [Amphiura filiformis]|uniref:uncharacterized protein n=1 Tax=Amphiura filiformis TaxID=82378 RepID=UPI003B2236FF